MRFSCSVEEIWKSRSVAHRTQYCLSNTWCWISGWAACLRHNGHDKRATMCDVSTQITLSYHHMGEQLWWQRSHTNGLLSMSFGTCVASLPRVVIAYIERVVSVKCDDICGIMVSLPRSPWIAVWGIHTLLPPLWYVDRPFHLHKAYFESCPCITYVHPHCNF